MRAFFASLLGAILVGVGSAHAIPITMDPGTVFIPFGDSGMMELTLTDGDFDGSLATLIFTTGISTPDSGINPAYSLDFDVPVISACVQRTPPNCPDQQSAAYQATVVPPDLVSVQASIDFAFSRTLVIELEDPPTDVILNPLGGNPPISLLFSLVPEPSTAALVAIGMAALALRARSGSRAAL
jgi:hypothetical protein